MEDIKDINSIKLFVDEFYNKVRIDALIGPIFYDVIKDDWGPHLERMYAFWNTVLFGETGFKGNPFAKHAPLPIGPEHFNRWLELFNQTIDQYFEGPVAIDAKNRAQLMAIMFQSKLDRMSGGNSKVIV